MSRTLFAADKVLFHRTDKSFVDVSLDELRRLQAQHPELMDAKRYSWSIEIDSTNTKAYANLKIRVIDKHDLPDTFSAGVKLVFWLLILVMVWAAFGWGW
jgi:hypothetical protein